MINLFPEQRAELTRLALGCPDFPERSLTRELICWLADCVMIETDCAVRRAQTSMVGERALIMLPRGLSAERLDEVALHEITHFLLKHRVAAFFREQGPMDLQSHRVLANRWEMAEESEVFAFLLAFFLPSRLVYVLRDADLVEQSGCTPELVQLRRQRLNGKYIDLREPPEWSAYWRYEVSFWDDDVKPYYRVAHREPQQRAYFIPIAPHETRQWQFRLNADLMALTVAEWQIKYRTFEAGPVQPATMSLQDLWHSLHRRSAAR